MAGARAGRVAVVVVLAALVTACDDGRAEALFDDAARLAAQGRYEEAMAAFREVQERYPRSRFAAPAAREVESLHDVLTAGRRYRTDRAVEIVRATTRAIERFHADQGGWPRRLDELVPRWIERVDRDPWGRPVRYERTSRGYRVGCFGADGEPGGAGDDRDVVVENGEFVARPAGITG